MLHVDPRGVVGVVRDAPGLAHALEPAPVEPLGAGVDAADDGRQHDALQLGVEDVVRLHLDVLQGAREHRGLVGVEALPGHPVEGVGEEGVVESDHGRGAPISRGG